MASKSDKLLDEARRSPHGWKRSKLDALYQAYGFEIDYSRSKHDIAYHRDYIAEGLRTTLSRSSKVHPAYVRCAVELIERLQALEAQKESEKKEEKENE